MSNKFISAIDETREAIRLDYCAVHSANLEAIKLLVGTVVGKVRVTIPQEYSDRSYECAAWSEDRISATGVYDVVIRQDPHQKDRLFFAANIPATVKQDYFPSLFCGNLIGQAYDVTKNAGKKCRDIVIVRADMAQAINDSSHSDADKDGTKWAIRPEFWTIIEGFHRAQVDQWMAYYLLAAFDFRNTEDDQYLSKMGQVGHAGENLRKHTDAVKLIARTINFRETGSTDYFTKNNPFLLTLQECYAIISEHTPGVNGDALQDMGLEALNEDAQRILRLEKASSI